MTRFRSILLLLAAMCIVTSSRDTTCLLEIDGTDVLQELLKGDAVSINIKLLNFVDSSDFATQVSAVDINRWVMISEKIGKLLLTFSSDFEYLSLGALSPGVEHIFLKVTSVPKCFFDVDNEDKLNIIAMSILQRISEDNVKQKVCIERRLYSITWVSISSILQRRTYFDCWQISEDDSSVESHIFINNVWFRCLYWITATLTSLKFELFFVSYLCHVKPMTENGKEYFSLRTDLPMGPNYANLKHFGGYCISFGHFIFHCVLMFKLECIFTYIYKILLYFYVGLLVNPGTAGVVAAMVVIVIGYVVSTITGYYKGYVVLLRQVISAFDELIKDNKVHVSGDKLSPFPQFTNHELPDENDYEEGMELMSASASNSTVPPNETPSNETFGSAPNDSTSLPAIRQDTEGLIAVDKTLFDLIVQKYRPTEIQLQTIIMKVLILSLVIWVGFSTLKVIDDFDELKEVKLYAAVAIAGIVSLFKVLLRNKAEEESKKMILEKCIRKEIEEYFNKQLSENWYKIMTNRYSNEADCCYGDSNTFQIVTCL
ncbi:uncharacterized protein [Antedon mediterranea]|uniref:uncharacterized protein n=1 Tax=Antedon mediterranea TaxID=105859 RepID=UPI003AF4F793